MAAPPTPPAWSWSLAALRTLMAEDEMDQHATVLRAFSVVELWRLRRVCRAFHRWGTAALAALPRLVAVGGTVAGTSPPAGVEVLDLSTLRWSSGVVPALPGPHVDHSACSFAGTGRVVVVGGRLATGVSIGDGAPRRTALQWVRGAQGWAPLPDMAEARMGAVAVALPDGRAMVIGGGAMVIGGWDDDNTRALASVEALAADCSGWAALTPMGMPRFGHVAVALPCGKVLVAGGTTRGSHQPIKTAELWDPATGAWSELPDMAHERAFADCCLLPDGRAAVVGGWEFGGHMRTDGEAFDVEAQTWQPLPHMAHARRLHGLGAVVGGLLAVGGTINAPSELFDEASGRWFELPHPMAEPRVRCKIVSLPASAPPAAGAVA